MRMTVVAGLIAACVLATAQATCYLSPGSAIEAGECTCHSSCATCGYGPDPSGARDCIACASTSDTLFPVYSDGTGICGTQGTCYLSPGNALQAGTCTCHSSCAVCGYNGNPSGAADCIACASTSDTLFPVYDDGTGTCGTQATVSTQAQCSAWLSNLNSMTFACNASATGCVNGTTTFADRFNNCQTGSPLFPDGNGQCTADCQELYDMVLPLARAAGRSDCWESRYYGVYYSLNCLTDQDGNSCGGMFGVYSQLNNVLALFTQENERASSGTFNKTHRFQSNLDHSTMMSTCQSSCLQDGIFMMMEMDSLNGNQQGGVDASMYDYLGAFAGYVCQEVQGEYCFPAGMSSMANIFMNDPFDATLADLDNFCNLTDRCPKLSMAKYISLFDFLPFHPNIDLLVQQFTELMAFDCMKHNDIYCLHALGGDDDPPGCGDGEMPDTSNAACATWLQSTINNAGCCIHAYDDLMQTMNSIQTSSGPGSGSSSGQKAALEDQQSQLRLDRWSVHRSMLDFTRATMQHVVVKTGGANCSAGSVSLPISDGGGTAPISYPAMDDNTLASITCADGIGSGWTGTGIQIFCSNGVANLTSANCQGPSLSDPECSAGPPSGCENADTSCCDPNGGVLSQCPTECVAFATSCCSGGGGGPMSVRAVVEAVGINFDALPDACPVTAYVLPVELEFQDMLLEVCQELLPQIIKDIAASTGVTASQVIGAACTALNTKSGNGGSKVASEVGVPTQEEASSLNNNVDIQLSNTQATAAQQGVAIGQATLVADTNNIVLATLTASPSVSPAASPAASPSTSPATTTSSGTHLSAALALALVAISTVWL